MPTVILRGCKEQGRAVSRLVLEGSSSNMIRGGTINGKPFEVTDEEFAKLDQRYVLETVASNGKPDDTEEQPSRLVAASEEDDS